MDPSSLSAYSPSPNPHQWLFSTDHKDIGTRYFVFAICAGLIGGALSLKPAMVGLALPAQLAIPENNLSAIHGIVMVFFTLFPALIGGFGNWFIPLLIGAPNLAFPRLNACSFWLFLLGFISLALALVTMGDGSNVGLYVSIAAALFAGVSVLFSAVNFVTTIVNMRAPGMSLHRLPLFVWSMLIAAMLLLLSLPILAGVMSVVLANVLHAAQSTLTEVPDLRKLFWAFAQPQVYILILPCFGMIAQIIASFSRRALVARMALAYAMLLAAIAAFTIWAHFLYSDGVERSSLQFFLIAAPILFAMALIQLLGWFATLRSGAAFSKPPLLWAMGFIFIFTSGGIAAIFSYVTDKSALSSDYYKVAHFHYALSLCVIFAILAGFYYWFPKMSGLLYSEVLARIHFWLFFIGTNLTFLPRQFAALASAQDWTASLNKLAFCGDLLSGLGSAVFIATIVPAFLRPRSAGANPWNVNVVTLEWCLPSPPPTPSLPVSPGGIEAKHWQTTPSADR